MAKDGRPAIPAVDAGRYQEQQIEQSQREGTSTAETLTSRIPRASDPLLLPVESPCFEIDTFEWRHADAFPWLRREAQLSRGCVGPNGLRAIRDWVTRRLIARGYVTSAATIPEQDLSAGRLIVEIVGGRIGAIDDGGGRIGWPAMLFPRHSNDLLNVRDLDQALENIRRLPGDSATAFDLVPGAALGDTDVIVRHLGSAQRARFIVTVDNSGLEATGRNQLGAIFAIDSPLYLYDQLVLTYNSDAAFHNESLGSQAKSAAWNVPIGYASVSLGVSEWTSRQTLSGNIPGFVVPPLEQRTRRYNAGLTFVPLRSGHGKTTLRFQISRREDRSWIGATELDVYRRDIVGYGVGVLHHEKLANGSVDAGIGMRGNVTGLSAHPGHVNDQRAWDGRYRIVSATLGADARFQIGARRFGYRGTFRMQRTPGTAPSTEFMQIGGRYTVRGFDGNNTLTGANGWTWRNELATDVFGATEIYAALDAGQVSGAGASEGAGRDGRTLVGATIGMRGGYKLLGYGVALGVPVRKPASLKTAAAALDLSMTTRF